MLVELLQRGFSDFVGFRRVDGAEDDKAPGFLVVNVLGESSVLLASPLP